MNCRYVVVLAALAGVLLVFAALNIRQAPWTGANAVPLTA